jgi:DNA-binding LytR/AlgR family response regulator
MVKLKCIVLDDEYPGRKILEEYISQTDFLQLSGSFSHPDKARPALQSGDADLLFLDIHMPKETGIEFMRSLADPPLVILVTAYSEYALEGFELDVVDYLLKPVSKERFIKACEKAQRLISPDMTNITTTPGNNHFFIKCNSQYEKVVLDELLFIEASNNCVLLHTRDRMLSTYLTFKSVHENLPKDKFVKVHKSYIVALNKIDAIDHEKVRVNGIEIPISRGMRSSVMQQVLSHNVLKQ